MDPSRDQLEIFIEGLFRHASPQGFVSLRAFHDDSSNKVFRITPTGLSGGLKFLIDMAEDDAGRAANWAQPVVFCPPIAVFASKENATDKNVAEGLALSVECDKQPHQAKLKLEQILGPATFVVASGGKWTNPETGEIQNKLHLHWRLRVPARGEDLAKLKQARNLAAELVGGDPSNKPICHPIRWPGSWHRKAEPTLCQIIEQNPDNELDLATAVAALEVVEPPRRASQGNSNDGDRSSTSPGWAENIQAIISGDNYHAALAALAMKLLRAGMSDSAAVNMLRALMENATGPRDDRWLARYNDIARAVSTAKEKTGEQQSEAPQPLSYVNLALDLVPREWLVPDRIPMRNVTLLSGEGSIGKSLLLMQLSGAGVLSNKSWIGTMPLSGPVLYVSCEEDDDEIRRRMDAVAIHLDSSRREMQEHGLRVLSFAGKDAILAQPDRNGIVRPTALFGQLRDGALQLRPKLIILDAAADVFGGKENERAQTRQFITLLRGLAVDADAAVVMVAHPSLTGIASDTGLSGTTAWHNSVRARMYFKPAPGDDSALRVLEVKKNNYGPVSESVLLRWKEGIYVVESRPGTLDQLAAEAEIDHLFLNLLRRFTEGGRNVSDRKSPTHAPSMFAREPEAKKGKITKEALEEAMSRLFIAKRIAVVKEGRASHQTHRIVEKGGAD
jgi:RecA-family ATPase